jgi:hypothetical protein
MDRLVKYEIISLSHQPNAYCVHRLIDLNSYFMTHQHRKVISVNQRLYIACCDLLVASHYSQPLVTMTLGRTENGPELASQ